MITPPAASPDRKSRGKPAGKSGLVGAAHQTASVSGNFGVLSPLDVGKSSNNYGVSVFARSRDEIMVLLGASDTLPPARLSAFNRDLAALDGIAGLIVYIVWCLLRKGPPWFDDVSHLVAL